MKIKGATTKKLKHYQSTPAIQLNVTMPYSYQTHNTYMLQILSWWGTEKNTKDVSTFFDLHIMSSQSTCIISAANTVPPQIFTCNFFLVIVYVKLKWHEIHCIFIPSKFNERIISILMLVLGYLYNCLTFYSYVNQTIVLLHHAFLLQACLNTCLNYRTIGA